MPLLWFGEYYDLIQFPETKLGEFPDFSATIIKNQRLGKLAETLFSLWVNTQKEYTIVFENLQIIKEKQTLGELDVLLLNTKTEQHIHLELITKFYLYNPAYNCNDIKAWIGPNRNDSLQDKTKKLKQKQLPLLYNETTQFYLDNFGLKPEKVIQKVCFKAWLFVPINFNDTISIFNKKCIAGHYVTFESFKSLHKKDQKYYCPQKRDWLRLPKTQKDWQLFETVLAQIELFMSENQSLMIWTQYKSTFKRYIIVPYSEF